MQRALREKDRGRARDGEKTGDEVERKGGRDWELSRETGGSRTWG